MTSLVLRLRMTCLGFWKQVLKRIIKREFIVLSSIQRLWSNKKFQTAVQELKTIAQADPKKIVVDTVTLLGTAKSFESHSIIGNYTLNTLGLHRFRVAQAARLAEARREKLAKYLRADEVEFFQQNGFILKENFLPEGEFELLSKELLETPFDTRETLQGDTVTRRMALDGKVLEQLPYTKRLLESQ